ncbi:uncharacterized protein MYCFIDRAFT_30459, partial [Pseudocercospora fijiensis CIRAD86]
LNFLTPARKVAAAAEIKDGVSISLDLPINHFAAVSRAFGGRMPPYHELHQIDSSVYEDSVNLNTQVSSQWDGFRHFGLRVTHQFYNGFGSAHIEDSTVLGTNAWIQTGAIVGRGVLVDVHAYFLSLGWRVDPNGGSPITLDHVLDTLRAQGTMIMPGDILIFRTGWLEWYNESSEQERYTELCQRHSPGEHQFIGLAQAEDFIAWLWDNQIAAVAGDQVAFECTPPPESGIGMLHEHLLAALGCPIGELFDVETLAKECEKRKRYSFFFTSAPLHVSGGVASPCNSIAIL